MRLEDSPIRSREGLETPKDVAFWEDPPELSKMEMRLIEVYALRRRKRQEYYRANKPKKKPGPRTRPYWKKRLLKKASQRRNYENNIKWQRLGMDCYDRLVLSCKGKGVPLELTREELREMIPDLDNLVGLKCKRYSTTEGYSKYNLVIRDKKTNSVLWDGKEEKLRDLGYIL